MIDQAKIDELAVFVSKSLRDKGLNEQIPEMSFQRMIGNVENDQKYRIILSKQDKTFSPRPRVDSCQFLSIRQFLSILVNSCQFLSILVNSCLHFESFQTLKEQHQQ